MLRLKQIHWLQSLEECKMARFDQRSGSLYITDLGRVASHYYIKHDSILVINNLLKEQMSPSRIINMIASCSEFESQQLREEEVPELEELRRKYCEVGVIAVNEKGHVEKTGKVEVLLQVGLARTLLPCQS